MFIYCKKCTSRETVSLKTRSGFENPKFRTKDPDSYHTVPLHSANDLKKSYKISRPTKNCFKG